MRSSNLKNGIRFDESFKSRYDTLQTKGDDNIRKNDLVSNDDPLPNNQFPKHAILARQINVISNYLNNFYFKHALCSSVEQEIINDFLKNFPDPIDQKKWLENTQCDYNKELRNILK